ncbi:hypothetical protein LCM00_14900 [Bacillus infantis]|uniref:hypothetical protein n=1 Tax=Bacillus infantis TaxID=324767 RepID=UPI001CD5E0BB|nr:hypothetical protein [Bacillus infantis]MCA1040801.1 hypothetical protein [Bacillus infantis]
MTIFLLAVSLIINLILIFAVALLYMRQNRLFEMEKRQGQSFREVEDSIAAFIVEIKEDNEKLLRNIQKNSQPAGDVHSEANGAEAVQAADAGAGLKGPPAPNLRKGSAMQKAVHAYSKKKEQMPEQGLLFPEDIVELGEASRSGNEPSPAEPQAGGQADGSILEQAQTLQEQGFAEEEIAKKLGRGKTEISLLLKFRQNRQ